MVFKYYAQKIGNGRTIGLRGAQGDDGSQADQSPLGIQGNLGELGVQGPDGDLCTMSVVDGVTDQLVVYYRADNVDGLGNPGSGATTTLKNLAPGATDYDGTIVNSTNGVEHNLLSVGTPFEYTVSLDTTSSYIDLDAFYVSNRSGENSTLSLNATWEFWLDVCALGGQGDYLGALGYLYSELNSSDENQTRNSLALYDGYSGGSRSLNFVPFDGVGATGYSSSQQYWQYARYQQLVVTCSSSTGKLKFYLDGALVNQQTLSAGTNSNTIDASRIGKRLADVVTSRISIVRIYDRELSASEVSQNYANEIYNSLGACPLVSLVDVHGTGASERDYLTYDSGLARWVKTTLGAGDVSLGQFSFSDVPLFVDGQTAAVDALSVGYLYQLPTDAPRIHVRMPYQFYQGSSFLLSYWPLDDGTGSSAVDVKGSNNLTLDQTVASVTWSS